MELHFSYNIDKDVENIMKSTQAVNNRRPTKFQELFMQKHGSDFSFEKVKRFIVERQEVERFRMKEEIATLEEKWRPIETSFIERTEKVFGINYPSPYITAYLTHNERCTYNIDENYFFVKIRSEFSNNIIMHELFHFYTWQAFGRRLLQEGFSKGVYNDIKESLTEILNLEFSDLMNGKIDKGYPQHQTMRAEVRKLWSEQENLANIVNTLLSRSNLF
jgi:hypothetical protein